MFMLRFDPDTFNVYANGNNPNLTTHRKFYDPSAWYHVVLAVDTTQSTAADRIIIYVKFVSNLKIISISF